MHKSHCGCSADWLVKVISGDGCKQLRENIISNSEVCKHFFKNSLSVFVVLPYEVNECPLESSAESRNIAIEINNRNPNIGRVIALPCFIQGRCHQREYPIIWIMLSIESLWLCLRSQLLPKSPAATVCGQRPQELMQGIRLLHVAGHDHGDWHAGLVTARPHGFRCGGLFLDHERPFLMP